MTTSGDTAIVTNPNACPVRLSQPNSTDDANDHTRILPPFILDCHQTAWIKATVAGTSVSVTKNLITGTYCISNLLVSVDGSTPNGNIIYTVYPMLMEEAVVSWSWTPFGNINVWLENGHSLKFDMNPNLTVKVTASSSNVCGTSIYSRTISGRGGGMLIITAYPNPVFDILNIEIDEEVMAQEQTFTDAQLLKEFTYDIRLYDGQGNLLRQTKNKGGTVQFNVSTLPNGIYFLHIYDGVSDTPEIRQIMVEH